MPSETFSSSFRQNFYRTYISPLTDDIRVRQQGLLGQSEQKGADSIMGGQCNGTSPIRPSDNQGAPTKAYSLCDHMKCALPRREADKIIGDLCYSLRNLDFDTVAFRGISGAIMAPVIAHQLNKEMILVRKNYGADCTSKRWVEGYKQAQNYIVLDDLICSGNSAAETILGVMLFAPQAKLVAIATYDKKVEIYSSLSTDWNYADYKYIITKAEQLWQKGDWRQHSVSF